MRYLITTQDRDNPFLTNWFEPENHFNEDVNMIVYDLYLNVFTTNGYDWYEINVDHL